MTRALAVLAVLLLAGCEPAGPRLVRVWSATDTDAMIALVEAFEATHPAVDIDYREFNTSELHAAVLAAPPGEGPDVVISSAMDLQVDLVNRGLAAPVEVEATLPEWSSWRGELYGFTAEPVALVYDRAAWAGRALPRTRPELAGMIRDDPAFFDGRVGTYDIAVSGVGYMFATEDAGRGYQSSRLVETLGRARVRLYCCTSDMLDGIASGRLVLAYNVIASYALAAARENPRIGVHALSDYTLVFARAAFVMRTAADVDAAADFLSYLVSPEGQATVASRSKLLPLAPGGAAADDLAPGASDMPIRMGPGLLTFLDTLKRDKFLRDWSLSIGPDSP